MPHSTDPYRDRYSARAAGMSGSEIRALFAVLDRPEIISLAGGLPETSIVEHRVLDCAHAVLGRAGREALQYGPAGGLVQLRERLVDLMAQEGVEADPHQIIVTDGAQQGLELLAKIFCNPGDVVLTEAPTYSGALSAFSSYQADIRSVATDGDGIIPEALEEMLELLSAEGVRAKFLYLVPTFQNPSGYTLSAGRRPRVVEICRSADLLIVEDNPYAQVRFEGEAVVPLRALSEEGILYLGTLSKVFSAGMWLGWVLAPEPVRERLVLAKEAADLCTSPFTQLLAAEYLGSGHVGDDLELIRKVYRERRDAMLDALDAYFPPEVATRPPQGGLFLWVTIDAPVDSYAMLARALENGVAYVPGTGFYPVKRDGLRAMRLNFSYASSDEIDEGMRRLGEVVTDELELARRLS